MLVLLCLALAFIIWFEANHYHKFGHFAGYGLHVDLLHEPMSFGIPGVTSCYSVQVVNCSVLPVLFEACQFPNDISPYYSLQYRGQIERFNPVSGSWEIVRRYFEPNDCPVAEFTKPKSIMLWPGQKETLWGWEATAGMTELSKGMKLRYRFYTRFREDDRNVKQQILVSPEFILTEEAAEKRAKCDIRFEGRIEKMSPKTFASGVLTAYRLVRYQVVSIINGTYTGNTIVVDHLVLDPDELEEFKPGDSVCLCVESGEKPLFTRWNAKEIREPNEEIHTYYLGKSISAGRCESD